MAINVAELEALLRLKDQMSPELQKAMSNVDKFALKMQAFGGDMSRAGQSISSVTGPLRNFAQASASAAIEAVESENLFRESFGGMAKQARDWSEELSAAVGSNEYELRKSAGTLYVMTESMGLASEDAFELSTKMTALSGDLSSFYNIPVEEALMKIRSGLVGEAEPLRRLGVLIDEATVKQTAYEHGLVKMGEELTQTQKVQARYLAIMDQTTKAQGDLARTLQSPANQLRIMGERMEEVKIKLGTALMPFTQSYVGILSNQLLPALENTVDWFTKLDPALQTVVGGFAGLVMGAGPVIEKLGGVAFGASQVLLAWPKMADAMFKFGNTVPVLTARVWLLEAGIKGVALAAGKAGLVVGTFLLAFKGTEWLINTVPYLKEATLWIGEMGMKLTGVQGALDYYNKQQEKGKDVMAGWTEEQKAAYAERLKQVEILKIQEQVQAQVTQVQVESTMTLEQEVAAAMKAKKEKETLKAATELLGREVTNLAEAQRILKASWDISLPSIAQQQEALKQATAQAADLTNTIQLMVNEDNRRRQELEYQSNMINAVRIPAEKELNELINQMYNDTEDMVDIERELDTGLGELSRRFVEGKEALGGWGDALEGASLIAGLFGGTAEQMVGTIGNISKAFQNAETDAEKFQAVLSGLGQIGAQIGGQIGGALQGAAGGAKMGSMFGPIGAGIGAAVGGIVGFISAGKKMRAEVQKMYDQFIESAGGLDELKEHAENTGVSLEEVFAKKGTKDVEGMKKAIEEATEKMEIMDELLQTIGGEDLEDLQLKAEEAGISLQAIWDAKTVDEYRDAVEGVKDQFDTWNEAQEKLNDAIERYGFTLEELPQKMKQDEIDQGFAQLYQDFELLKAAGFDVGTILSRMGPSINDMVQQAVSAGGTVPAAMKPIIDQMIAEGKLLDENGNAYTSAEEAGITYAQTMSEMFTSLIEKVDELVNALLGINDIDVSPNVHIPTGGGGGGGGNRPPYPDVQAQQGFYSPSMPSGPRPGGGTDIRVHPGEEVSVRPRGAGGADSQPLKVIVNIGPEKLYEMITKATKGGQVRVYPDSVKAF